MLDAEHFQATKALQNDCSTFMGRMAELNSLVQTYLEVLDKQVGMILFEEPIASCRRRRHQQHSHAEQQHPNLNAAQQPPSPQQVGNSILLSAGSKD